MWLRRIFSQLLRKENTPVAETARKLTCQEAVELVTDYLEAVLLPERREQFEAHLSTCDGCTAYMTQVRQTIHMLHMLSNQPVFPETREALQRVFQTWEDEQHPSGSNNGMY